MRFWDSSTLLPLCIDEPPTDTASAPNQEIRELARRLLRVHPLRAADALQLAAAYLVSERRLPTLEVVTQDDGLRQAGLKEGFVVTAL